VLGTKIPGLLYFRCTVYHDALLNMKTTLLPLAAVLLLTFTTTAQTFSLQDFAAFYRLQGVWVAHTERGLEYEQWEIRNPQHLEGKVSIVHTDTRDSLPVSSENLQLHYQNGQILYTAEVAYSHSSPVDTFRLKRIDQGDYIFETGQGSVLKRTVYHPEADSVLEKYLEVPWANSTGRFSLIYRNTGQVTTNSLLNPAYLLRKAKALAEPSVFQNEIDGKFPERLFYQDSLVTVLRSISPQEPFHLLVIPNRRIPTLNDATPADEALLGHMLLTARDMVQRTTHAETGYRLVINTNENAGQSAFHLHLHVLGGNRTGPMVDQTWRNVRRRLADSTHVTSFEKRILGSWVSKTPTAEASMKWEPDLQNRFMVLTYKLDAHPPTGPAEIFEGKAFYKNAGKSDRFNAQWMDSNGDIFPVEGHYNGHEFITLWGTPATQQGKCVYRFLDDQTIELTDWRKDEKKGWVVFNRYTFRKT